jgi:hypothetical protein
MEQTKYIFKQFDKIRTSGGLIFVLLDAYFICINAEYHGVRPTTYDDQLEHPDPALTIFEVSSLTSPGAQFLFNPDSRKWITTWKRSVTLTFPDVVRKVADIYHSSIKLLPYKIVRPALISIDDYLLVAVPVKKCGFVSTEQSMHFDVEIDAAYIARNQILGVLSKEDLT